MKSYLTMTLLCIVSGALAAPQKEKDRFQSIKKLIDGAGGFEDIMNNKVIQGILNPCNGVPPATCQCTNGEIIQLFIETGRGNPCSGSANWADKCTCPKGNTFKIKELIGIAIYVYNQQTSYSYSCGRGVEPSFCTCDFNSNFDPQTLTGPPCRYPGLSAIPNSCTCPGGNTITRTDIISRALPYLKALLG